jgi:hypothetical protein
VKTLNAPRVAYTVEEFAALFGRCRGWAYRMIAQKKVKVIAGYGKAMVPATEVERILGEGGDQ